MRVKELVAFIKEREAIRVKKEAGKPRPWTKDPILDKYRFCNVSREFDTVTRWLRKDFYYRWDEDPLNDEETDPDIWFACVVGRLFNNPEALAEVEEHVVPWEPECFVEVLHARKAKGWKNFNAAYIVSTNGRAMDKVDYLVEHVLNPLWAAREHLRCDFETWDSWSDLLMEYDGMAGFMAGQVIADLKHYSPWDMASDQQTFALSGPGSRRGLNRVMNFPVDQSWREYEWHDTLLKLRYKVLPLLPRPIHAIDAQDLQNCLCEFDKYERARLGEGTPKQIYKER